MNKELLKDKWLEFIEQKSKLKTKVFKVQSKCSHDILGIIKWYPQWRHYCYFPKDLGEYVYSNRCLSTISAFITTLNMEYKSKKAEK